MKPKLLKTLGALAVFAAAVGEGTFSSQAATCTPPSNIGDTCDWASTGDWTNATVTSSATGKKLPAATAGDVAVITQNRVVQVTTAVDVVAGDVYVNDQNPPSGNTTGTLQINTGGSLNAGIISVPRNTNAGTLYVQGGTLGCSGALTIKQNGTVNVSSGSLTLPHISIGNGLAGVTTNGILNISGGTVTVTNDPSLANASLTNNGVVNLSGGSLTFVDPVPGGSTLPLVSGTNTFNMTGGSFVVAGETGVNDAIQLAQGIFNLSGGRFLLTNGQVTASGSPTINIFGTNTTIQMHRLNLSVPARAMTFGFCFSSNGVSTVTSFTYMNLDNATINIDGSAYTRGAGSYKLFTSPSFIGSYTYTANITAPFPGLKAAVARAGNDLVLTLSVSSSTWDGDSDGKWSVAANWVGNALPAVGDALVFGGTANSTTVNDLTAGTLFNGIGFTNPGNGQSFSLGGNGLQLGGNITSAGVTAPDSIADSIALGLQLAGSGLSISPGSNHDLTISSAISEDSSARGFAKAGGGTLTLTGTNTYSGVTTVIAGILAISSGSALGTTGGNTVVGSGSELVLQGGINCAEPLTLNGSGINPGPYSQHGALISEGNNTLSGPITCATTTRFATLGTNTLTVSGGITSSANNNALVGDFAITGNPINVGANSIWFSGNGNSGGKIRLNVAGNNWSDALLSFAGIVQLGVDDAMPTNASVQFGWTTADNSRSTLDLNGHNQTVATIETSANALSAGPSAWQNISITGGGTLTVNQSQPSKTFTGVISDGSTPTALVKAATGTLILSGTNTYTGNTIVSGGTLELAVASIATNSTVSVASGAFLQLDFTGTNRVAGLVLNGVSQAAGVYNATTGAPYLTGGGSLEVASVTPSPATLINSVSGGVLSLSWPAGQGWQLQAQTNALSTGLNSNWSTVSSASPPFTNTINPANPAVFYRLYHP